MDKKKILTRINNYAKNFHLQIVEIFISGLTLFLGFYALNTWRNEKKFEIEIDAKSKIYSTYTLLSQLSSIDYNDNTTLSLNDSLALKDFYLISNIDSLQKAINFKSKFQQLYNENYSLIMDIHAITQKMEYGDFDSKDSLFLIYKTTSYYTEICKRECDMLDLQIKLEFYKEENKDKNFDNKDSNLSSGLNEVLTDFLKYTKGSKNVFELLSKKSDEILFHEVN